MKNSDVPNLTRPLKNGEKIEEGDIFRTNEGKLQWLEVACYCEGVQYDPTKHAPMRRPIPQSMEFICSKEKKEELSLAT